MTPMTVGGKSSVMAKGLGIKGEYGKNDTGHPYATSPMENKNKNNFFPISLGKGGSVMNPVFPNDTNGFKHDTMVKQAVSSVSYGSWLERNILC